MWSRRPPSATKDVLLNDLGTFHNRITSTKSIGPPRSSSATRCVNLEIRRLHQSERKLRKPGRLHEPQHSNPQLPQSHDRTKPSTPKSSQSPNDHVPIPNAAVFEDDAFKPYTAEEKESLCAELGVMFFEGRPIRGLPIALDTDQLRKVQQAQEQIKKSLAAKVFNIKISFDQVQYTPLRRKRVRRLMEMFYLDERDALFRRAAGDETANSAIVSNQYLFEQIGVVKSHIRFLEQQRKPFGLPSGKGLPMNRYKASPNVRVDMAEMDEWKLLLTKHEALQKAVKVEVPPHFRNGAFEELPDTELPKEHRRDNERYREDRFMRRLKLAEKVFGVIAVGSFIALGIQILDGPRKPVPSPTNGQAVTPDTPHDVEQQNFWNVSKVAAEQRERNETGRGDR